MESNNKQLYRRFVDEIIGNGRFELIPELFSSDYLDHSAPPGAPEGLAGVETVFSMFRTGFPDVHFEIQEMVEEGDTIATRVIGTGTHDGPFMGTPPSGRKATWGSTGIFRVRDGRIVEHWGIPDLVALLVQIGAMPAQANAAGPQVADKPARVDAPPTDPHDPVMLGRNKDVIRWAFEEAFTKGALDDAVKYIAADYVDHPPARTYELPLIGPDSLTHDVVAFRTAFPDLVATVDAMVAEGNRVVCRSSFSGTHGGDFFGIPATGKPFSVQAINFFRLADGQVVERFGSWDVISFLGQLGILPEGPPS